MKKALKIVVISALFILACVSTILISVGKATAMEGVMPQATQVAALLPFVAIITTAFSFFLLSWMLRLVCAFFLYKRNLEIPGKEIQFAVYVSTAVGSLANLVRWFLLTKGFIKAEVSLGMPGVTRDQVFHIMWTDTIPVMIVLAVLAAAVPVLMFWKSQPAEKRKSLVFAFGFAYVGWNLLGIAFQLASFFLSSAGAQ
jgi:hypothetical protein